MTELQKEEVLAFESSPQKSTADERWSGVERRAGGASRVTKVVVLGNTATGKTSIIRRFAKGEFLEKYRATIGADFLSKQIKLPATDRSRGKSLSLQIWDTAGQERWKALSAVFFRGADACVLVCATDDRDSLLVGVGEWLAEFCSKQVSGDSGGPVIVLAVTKTDLSDWKFTKAEVVEVAKRLRISTEVKFVSASTGEGVDDLFEYVAAEILATPPDTAAEDTNQPLSTVTLGRPPPSGEAPRDCISASCRSC